MKPLAVGILVVAVAAAAAATAADDETADDRRAKFPFWGGTPSACWANWTSWSRCSGQVKRRQRRCSTSGRGVSCPQPGKFQNCVVACGVWMSWSRWTSCSSNRRVSARTRCCWGGDCRGSILQRRQCCGRDAYSICKYWRNFCNYAIVRRLCKRTCCGRSGGSNPTPWRGPTRNPPFRFPFGGKPPGTGSPRPPRPPFRGPPFNKLPIRPKKLQE